MASTVVNDYKANKDAPEIQRLRAIAQKRAAFTGNVEGAPGAGAAGAPAAGGVDPGFGKLVDRAFAQRVGG
jgi:hypothetical protein